MMIDNMNEQHNIANIERAIRVIQQAKAMTCVKYIHDNIVYIVEIETNENDNVEIGNIKNIISTVLSQHKKETHLVQSKMLFLALSTMYNNHDVVIKINDINECGLKVHYNNLRPVQLMKI